MKSLNYEIMTIKNCPRTELKQALNLSGCEISINELPENVSVPFVHSHKQNEEIYIVLEGEGKLYIDKEEINIKKGDVFKIDPKGERCISAAKNSTIKFICIQTKAGSLEQFSLQDAVICENKPSWL